MSSLVQPSIEPVGTKGRKKKKKGTTFKVITLKEHQYGPSLALFESIETPTLNHKGVIAFYEVGTGKTFAALHAAHQYLVTYKKKKVYVISPKSNVDATWNKEWKTYQQNMGSVRGRLHCGTLSEIKKQIEARKTARGKSLSKTDYLLIVDEAHQYRNPKACSSKQVFDLCRTATFTILLTATPMVSQPSDLNALVNFTRARPHLSFLKNQIVLNETATTPPTSVDVLQDWKHAFLFQKQDTKLFPKVTTSTIKVEIGEEYRQFATKDKATWRALTKQLKSSRKGGEHWKKTVARALLNTNIPNPFLVKSRQACNTPAKWQAIYTQIRVNDYPRVLVYSNFIGGGIQGFFEWLIDSQAFQRTTGIMYQKCTNKSTSTEVVLWNADTVETAKEIVRWQHKEDAIHKILLVTPKGREGLSLKGVRAVHLMEPSWNCSDEEQIVGRACRLTSHTHLPPAQRRVQVYKWMASFKKMETSDKRVRDLAKEKANSLKPYLQKMRELGRANLKRLLKTVQPPLSF